MKRILLALLALGVVAAFGAPAAFAGGSGQTLEVSAGPLLKAPPPGISPHSDVLAFFPARLTVHVGDTVKWNFAGFHTVTFPGRKVPFPFVRPKFGLDLRARGRELIRRLLADAQELALADL